MDDLESLVQQVATLMNKPSSNTPAISNPSSNPSSNSSSNSSSKTYQAPIKGTFYNSGDFSLSATDKRHPTGHLGVDLRAPGGTQIYPVASGIVTNVGTDPKGGNVINIQHDNNVRSYYAHLGEVNVHKGDRVNLDTVIGTVGDSGNAKDTVPHCHFQIWENGSIQNPNKYFSIPKFTNFNRNSEKTWLDETAKNNSRKFNMKKHLANKTFAHKINTLYTLSQQYYLLALR